MTKTKKLLEHARQTELLASERLRIDYPIGMEVTWEHGEHLRRAHIESYAYGTAVFVRTATDKRVYLEIAKVHQ